MGVPSFYRWLSMKYPNIIVNAKADGFEEEMDDEGGYKTDLSTPNPNGMEFDNLYLDMNGIIHPCVHPEDQPAPKTLGEMFQKITEYIERLMHTVRPRRLLYMAIDGVAPRAKMNQQRSRRFRTAKDMKDAAEVEEEQRLNMMKRGYHIPPKKKHTFDHNVITPGTEFMDLLAKHLMLFVRTKCSQDPYWRSLKVVLSDASAPGEGEHKIMEFIRMQRAQAGYNPNVRHILHGLDADLIMLGLATHEAHFTILREEVTTTNRKCFRCGQSGHQTNACTGKAMIKRGEHGEQDASAGPSKKFKPLQFLRLDVLREYFAVEFEPVRESLPAVFEFDLERIIDDFIFMCFFVGNDFLPHLPSLDIREGAVDLLITMYKRLLPGLGGYLTHNGEIDFSRADVLLAEVGAVEDTIFRRRMAKERSDKRYRDRQKAQVAATRKAKAAQRAGQWPTKDSVGAVAVRRPALQDGGALQDSNKQAAAALRAKLMGKRKRSDAEETAETTNKEAGTPARAATTASDDATPATGAGGGAGAGAGAGTDAAADAKMSEAETDNDVDGATDEGNGDSGEGVSAEDALYDLKIRTRVALNDASIDETVTDDVKLGENGWKDRYYCAKFGEKDGMDAAFRRKMFKHYAEGLCWVFRYYYHGVASWTWFYPYHYAPFASDMVNIDQYDIKFEVGKPFPPLAQLMGVLPAESAHALPEACRWLMESEESPIADFYPREFELDPNGQRQKWKWIALLPFIDEKRLLDALASIENTFSADEKRRNSLGRDTLIFSIHHPLAAVVRPLYGVDGDTPAEQSMVLRLSDGHPEDSKGVAGTITVLPKPAIGARVDSPPESWLPSLASNQTMGLRLDLPEYHPHVCSMLPGAKPEVHEVKPEDRRPRPVRLNRRFNIADLAHPSARGGGGGNRGRGMMMGYNQNQGSHGYGARNNTRSYGGNNPGYGGHSNYGGNQRRGGGQGGQGGRYGGHAQQQAYGARNGGGYEQNAYKRPRGGQSLMGAPQTARVQPAYAGGYSHGRPGYGAQPPQAYGSAPRSSGGYGGGHSGGYRQQQGPAYSHGGSGYTHGGTDYARGGYSQGGGGYAHGGSYGSAPSAYSAGDARPYSQSAGSSGYGGAAYGGASYGGAGGSYTHSAAPAAANAPRSTAPAYNPAKPGASRYARSTGVSYNARALPPQGGYNQGSQGGRRY